MIQRIQIIYVKISDNMINDGNRINKRNKKEQLKLIILIIAIIMFIALSSIAYHFFSKNYAGKYYDQTADKEIVSESLTDGEEVAESDSTGSGQAESAASSSSSLPTATDFTVTDYEGNETRLSDYFGTPIVVNFWATWCPPCTGELDSFNKMYLEYSDMVQFMMVDLTDGESETKSGVDEFVAEKGYQFPVFYDTKGSAVIAYGITAIPQTVFINADGSIYSLRYGAMQEDELLELIQIISEVNS